MSFTNAQGQPIGAPMADWSGCKSPQRVTLTGQYCDIVPLNTAHTADLHQVFAMDKTGTLWTYMPVGPFASEESYAAWVAKACQSVDPMFFAIIDKQTSLPLGVVSLLRIQPDNGVIEVGFITFAPSLQRTAGATEAMYLMMAYAFDTLGYRRYEWKCDALNAPSRAAAKRLGFRYDGLFEQAVVYKGRNRDTAWFSILDGNWPALKHEFNRWLAPQNFDANGNQKSALKCGQEPLQG